MEEEQLSDPEERHGSTTVSQEPDHEDSVVQQDTAVTSKQDDDCSSPDQNQNINESRIELDNGRNERTEEATDVQCEQEHEDNLQLDSNLGNGHGQNFSEDQTAVISVTPRKAKKRGIFVSYSPEASFEEKRFVSYTVKELKNLGFSDDIWFDKDDGAIGSPLCSQQRLEIVEKCRAALIFLSNSYLNCKLCQSESTVLLTRQELKSVDSATSVDDRCIKPVRLFCINFNVTNVPATYRSMEDIVDLTSDSVAIASVAEKSSAVVGAFSEEIEKYALLYGTGLPTFEDREGSFKSRRVYYWDVNDVQDWLGSMKIHQRFCLTFEENQIDGFLLLSLDVSALESHLMVDSKIVRRKLLQHLKGILDKENLSKERWYMKLSKVKIKEECIYIIFDPTDIRFMERLKAELVRKYVQVHHHERLGKSKDEFLQLNGSSLASSNHVILIMSSESAKSLFVYNELLFAYWLGKPVVVAMVKNSWDAMRLNLQALLGCCPAVDFETKPYNESLDVMLYHVKPFRNMPAVILEQEFLDRMVEGIKPLQVLINNMYSDTHENAESPSIPKVFLSYHWDVQSRVEKLVKCLESEGFDCCIDVNTVSRRVSPHSGSPTEMGSDNLQSQILRKMKSSSAVICCVTHKYICSENCSNDLNLANSLSKPIIPLMFQWMSWPPEGLAIKVRKRLAPLQHFDMSNDKLFKRNLNAVILQLKKHHNTLNAKDNKKSVVHQKEGKISY